MTGIFPGWLYSVGAKTIRLLPLVGLFFAQAAWAEYPLELSLIEPNAAPLGSIEFHLDDGEEDSDSPISWARFQEPVLPAAPPLGEVLPLPSVAERFATGVFASEDVRRSVIAESRGMVPDIGTELVFGAEGRFRVTTDVGNLLEKALSTPSVKTQRRSPIVNEPRVRSARTGRLLASGSYWAPARDDLDTMLSKIDSRIIRDVVVVKGPYSVRYGPGFNFIDFQLLETPRYVDGYQYGGSSSIEYNTNGEQWYGRQAVWGGGENYGYRVGYGHRTGNDYETGFGGGQGFTIPASYNSRNLDVALGYDFSPDSRLEFTYLRLDQTNVEFPGLVFDINMLVTDGFEVTYIFENQPEFDRMTIDGWYNRTRFEGDTRRPGKNRQIPSIRGTLDLAEDQFLVTDVDGMSAGYRAAFTWGLDGEPSFTAGTDLIRVGQQLNDVLPERVLETPFFSLTFPEQNFPIPRSQSYDFGFFADQVTPINDSLRVNLGARVDLVRTNARERVPGMGVVRAAAPGVLVLEEVRLSELKQAELQQNFTPWALYATGTYEVDPALTLIGGVGHAMRPPTLTELYAAGPFIGRLQPGLSFVQGDPELNAERMIQVDVGARVELNRTRMAVNGFYAWIHDYITYDHANLPIFDFVPGEDFQEIAFVNTELATLTGFEFMAEQDIDGYVTAFAIASYVQGTDRTRSTPSRIGAMLRSDSSFPEGPRSLAPGDKEPLPGIPPLEARLGLRLHEPVLNPQWLVELEARVVSRQNRVAASLFEEPTPGFTIWNVRGYRRFADWLTLVGGVENFTDRFYREHLDPRAGRGVFRPGINFYSAIELTY